MEIRKNKLKRQILDIRRWTLVVGTLLLVFSILAQPVLALTANVRIEGPTKTIFDGDVNVPKIFKFKDANGDIHTFINKEINALDAAANAGGFPYQISWSSLGLSLKSINGISDPNWSKYWNQRVNWSSAQEGIGSKSIENGDKILLHYTSYPPEIPLYIEASKTTIQKNENLKLTVYAYNEANNKFEPTKATVDIGGQDFETDGLGVLKTSFASIGQKNIYAKKTGFIRSNKVQIIAGEVVSPQSLQQPVAQSNAPVTQAKNLTSSQIKKAIRNSLNYLRKRQSKNGKIENPAVSAWAAIAFAAANVNPLTVRRHKKQASLADYLKAYSQKNLNRKWLKKHPKATKPLATDYARQIMAIYAANRNPRHFGGINHIKELARFFNQGQFGDVNLLNDDIFAIIAYKAGKVGLKDFRFRKAVQFVLNNQHKDGGFSYSANSNRSSDVDTTAAAIQALVLTRKMKIANIESALKKAYNYMLSKQNTDGGFQYDKTFAKSNSQSTSWGSQAIAAFKGRAEFNKLTAQGLNPLGYLSTLQSANGGFSQAASNSASAWATTSVVPALAKRPWLVRYRRPLTIHANTKRAKKGKPVTITGRNNTGVKGILVLRCKNNKSKWKTLRKIKINSRRYKFKVRMLKSGKHVFSVKLKTLTSRNMVLFGK